MRPTIVSISGFSSEVGKTTVLCELLRLAPGWEAIKITRGHYRSCGKDPDACCVSSILREEPVVLSDRRETYIAGKDTGRYWDAGARMVHWAICTDDQIEQGIKIALARVECEGVLVEGASFLKYMDADYSIMVASPSINDIKSSAVRVLPKMNALVINRSEPDEELVEQITSRLMKRGAALSDTKIYFEQDLPLIGDEIRRIHEARYSILRQPLLVR
jgi:hypothetical protein